jgi:hypothetical protein
MSSARFLKITRADIERSPKEEEGEDVGAGEGMGEVGIIITQIQVSGMIL